MLTPKFSYLAPDMILPRVPVSLYPQSHSPSMQELSPHFLFWDSIILSPTTPSPKDLFYAGACKLPPAKFPPNSHPPTPHLKKYQNLTLGSLNQE